MCASKESDTSRNVSRGTSRTGVHRIHANVHSIYSTGAMSRIKQAERTRAVKWRRALPLLLVLRRSASQVGEGLEDAPSPHVGSGCTGVGRAGATWSAGARRAGGGGAVGRLSLRPGRASALSHGRRGGARRDSRARRASSGSLTGQDLVEALDASADACLNFRISTHLVDVAVAALLDRELSLAVRPAVKRGSEASIWPI